MVCQRLNEEIERRFRWTVSKTKGTKKGTLKLAYEEAMKLYIDDAEKNLANVIKEMGDLRRHLEEISQDLNARSAYSKIKDSSPVNDYQEVDKNLNAMRKYLHGLDVRFKRIDSDLRIQKR